MWRTGFRAITSHWQRHPGQAITLVLGLALATALWTGVQAINAEARASYDRAADVVTQGDLPYLVAREGDIPLSTYVALRRAGWQVAPVIEGRTRLGGRSISLVGIDPLSTPVRPGGEDTGVVAMMAPPGVLFGAPETVATMTGAEGLPELRAVDDIAPDTLIGDVGIVADLLNKPDHLSRLIMAPDQADGQAPLAEIAPDLDRVDPEGGNNVAGLTRSFHLNLTAFGMMSFFVGLFIVHGTVGLAFEQRRVVFRTLRALGLPTRQVTVLAGVELASFALVAGIVGVALGYAIAAALLPGIAGTLQGLYGAPAPGSLSLRPQWVLAGLGMSLFGTALAGAPALWKMHRLPVLAASHPQAWRRISGRVLGLQAVAALAAFALAIILAFVGSGLGAGFALLGALLLGAALALPPFLAMILKQAGRLTKRPVAQWFWADSMQQLPGLSLALMAMLLALSANIGVSAMVGSFRLTFESYLDQRLASEIYVDAGSEARAADMADWLAPQTLAILPRASTEATISGVPGSVQALTDHATYREAWPLLAALPDAWDQLAAGDGMFINEQVANRNDLPLGATVDLAGKDTRVLGIYADYGNPRAQAVLGIDTFRARFPDVPQQRFALRVPPAEMAPLTEALIARYDLRSDQIIDQRALKASSLRVFEQTFAVTDALSVLTFGVAALALLTSLLTLANMRLPQVAPLWALGLTRVQIGALELARVGLLAVLTAVFAVPVGLLLSWTLLAIVNVEAFGWRLPMRAFPGDWLRLGVMALIVGLVAALWPARKLVTRPPSDLLRVFANER